MLAAAEPNALAAAAAENFCAATAVVPESTRLTYELIMTSCLCAACSWRRAPRLWLIALIAALVLLLTVILCAVLVGNNHPKFVSGPSVLAASGYGFDTSMVIDHSGFVYYTVIPSELFLDDLDPG